jgi:WD40 repeat protein
MLSPDRERLVYARDGVAVVVDLATGRAVRELPVDAGPLAFHPSGKLVAVSTGDGFALWNVDTGEATLRWNRHDGVLALAFDAEGRHLAVGATSGVAAIWDLETGAHRAVTPLAGAPVAQLAYGPGGSLATGSRMQRESTTADLVTVWRADGTHAWSRELERLEGLAFQPRSGLLATASKVGNDRALMLWHADGGSPVTMPDARTPFAWRSDGALAYRDDDRRTTSVTGVRGRTGLDVSAAELAFPAAGDLLAVGEDSGRLSVWDTTTGAPIAVADDEHGAHLTWNADGTLLASAAGTTVRLRDGKTAAILATLTTSATIAAIAIHPSGRYLAAGCVDGTVELWSVATAQRVATLAGGHLVLALDAVDGEPDVGDALFWRVGKLDLPALGAWDRARSPGVLASRLRELSAETRPRPALQTPPPPPPAACFTRDTRVLTSWTATRTTIELCVDTDRDRGHPACFTVDVAAGTYTPRAPTTRERLGPGRVDPDAPTVHANGRRVEVCHAGHCRELEIADDVDVRYLVTDARGTLVAAPTNRGPRSVVVHDVATGRLLFRGAAHAWFPDTMMMDSALALVGESTLVVSSTPCAGPCTSSVLVDARTGRLIAHVGGVRDGRGALTAGALDQARVAGDVYAFSDWSSTLVVYQDVRTGKIVRRTHHPLACSGIDCEVTMVHVDAGVAVLPREKLAGDVAVLDRRGAIAGHHHLPICP